MTGGSVSGGGKAVIGGRLTTGCAANVLTAAGNTVANAGEVSAGDIAGGGGGADGCGAAGAGTKLRGVVGAESAPAPFTKARADKAKPEVLIAIGMMTVSLHYLGAVAAASLSPSPTS